MGLPSVLRGRFLQVYFTGQVLTIAVKLIHMAGLKLLHRMVSLIFVVSQRILFITLKVGGQFNPLFTSFRIGTGKAKKDSPLISGHTVIVIK